MSSLHRMFEIVRRVVSAESPADLCSFAKGDRRSAGLENGFESGRPERLPRAFKTAKLRGQVS